jgi:hypothetical protein
MDLNFIRSGIFLVAGLLMIFFPSWVCRFPMWVFKKLGIKRNVRDECKSYIWIGLMFVLVAVVLFLVAAFW